MRGDAFTTKADDASSTGCSPTGTGQLVNKTYFDALGRVSSTVDGLGQTVQKAYRYGTGGASYQLVSNPFASTGDATMGWTLTTHSLGTPSSGPTATSVTGYQGATLPGAGYGRKATYTGCPVGSHP